jgi:N12 class adenine-specific DNA methylase
LLDLSFNDAQQEQLPDFGRPVRGRGEAAWEGELIRVGSQRIAEIVGIVAIGEGVKVIARTTAKLGKKGWAIQRRIPPDLMMPLDEAERLSGTAIRRPTITERHEPALPPLAQTAPETPAIHPDEAQPEEDFDLTQEDIGQGGLTQKYRDNIAALRILKAMSHENRKATPEERRAIARYVGWGALKGVFDPGNTKWAKQHTELRELLTADEWGSARASILNAHYTSPTVVTHMHRALSRLGFRRGRILEPSVGVGNFFGLMPADVRRESQLFGVEIDPLTSRIASALYPSAQIKTIGFQYFDIPSEYFDVVVGNPPFGNEPIADPQRHAYSGFSIHNYFMAKSIDKLRPGGLMAMVVSHYFMDSGNDAARKWISQRAKLVSAVRLPNTAFKENAGTEVVTDILIFQKLSRDEQPDSTEWIDTEPQTLQDAESGEMQHYRLNRYFIQHPENILGIAASSGSMYKAAEYTVEPEGDLAERIGGWVAALPEGIYQPFEWGAELEAPDIAIPDGLKVGCYFVAENGGVMIRTADIMGKRTAAPWESPSLRATERMKGMIALRDGLRTQMRMELSANSTEDEIERGRKALNALYDRFHKQNGFLHDPTNTRLFYDDAEFSLLMALEFDYDRGVSEAIAARDGIEPKKPSANKADILLQRVLFPHKDDFRVENAKDALLASLDYKGRMDLDYMVSVYPGKSAGEIIDELGDVLFNDPLAGLVMADEYLSGDVKTKLDEAKAAALENPAYQRNVAALEKVIPLDKRPSEINVTLGAAFVPANIFAEFGEYVTGVKPQMAYIPSVAQWVIDFPHGQPDFTLNRAKFGTTDMPAVKIFQATFEGRGVVVTKNIDTADGKKFIVLEQETAAAREKQEEMKAEWVRWLWSNPEHAHLVASIFNEKFNRIVPRKYDGSHMTFPGMSPTKNLMAHQKNAAWRSLQSRQVLFDHTVGAGKTALIVATLMEMRRLNICRKPLIAVPNHITLQWQSEFYKFFPAARVLAATPDDFSKGNREKFFSKIVTGDWDAVVIGHSSLKKIGLPEHIEKSVLTEQVEGLSKAIEELKNGRGDKNVVRDMERIKARLEARAEIKLHQIGERDKVLTFDELGIDAFIIDELHEFKNLYYNTTMDRVPGMGNPSGSDKAFDLFIKTQWMWEKFGDKAILIAATGTPISNSMVEMFNLQRYLQYPELKKRDLHVFDAWARQFASATSVYEVSPSGTGYRQSSRLEFSGLNTLMPLYQSFTDTITIKTLIAQEQALGRRFPVPRIAGGQPTNVVAERSPQVAKFMGVPELSLYKTTGQPIFRLNLDDSLVLFEQTEEGDWRAIAADKNNTEHRMIIATASTEEGARQTAVQLALTPEITVDRESILGQFQNIRELFRETNGKINALSLTNQANKAGLDYRLIDPAAPDFPGSKINLAVERIVSVYRKWHTDRGTQLVFCDLSVPLSARQSLGTKDIRLYIRDKDGKLAHSRGTLHSIEEYEGFPFYIVGSGKGKGIFAVHDAVSGVFITGGVSKAEAIEEAGNYLKNDDLRKAWADKRDLYGEITQDSIDEYNGAHGYDENAEGASVSAADVIAMSGGNRFSVYDDIRQKLIGEGIPPNEIAFIHDYPTPAAKDKLFRAVNRGSIRILMGSTPKMGAGTNVQERLVGLHHIDAPWRPSDLEQREGRIIRQGNALYMRDPDGFEIEIFRYATAQTYDTRRWQLLEHKARMIAQVREYDGTVTSVEDITGEAANAADMKAAASGDPLILENTRLQTELKRLKSLELSHYDEARMMVKKADKQEKLLSETYPDKLKRLQDVIAAAEKHPVFPDVFPGITVDGKLWGDRDQAITAIKSGIANTYIFGTPVKFEYRGVHFEFVKGNNAFCAIELLSPTGVLDYFNVNRPELASPAGFIQRFANYVNKAPNHVETLLRDIEAARQSSENLRAMAAKPFDKTEEIEATRNALRNVQRQLIAKGPDIPKEQKLLLEEALKMQREKLVEQGLGEDLAAFMGEGGKPITVPTHQRIAAPSGTTRHALPKLSYQSTLDRYILNKRGQATRLNMRLIKLISRQKERISAAGHPGWLTLPATKKEWSASKIRMQERLETLQDRMERVRSIEEGTGVLRPKIEELAIQKLRSEHPALAAEQDAMSLTTTRNSIRRQDKAKASRKM